MAGFLSIIIGLVLGIVQGVSEWLPVSSKTQILVTSTLLLHLNFNQAYALGLFLEGGTFLAALIYFRKEVWMVILALFRRGTAEGVLLLKYLVVVTVITAIIAIPIYKLVESLVSGPVIGIPMIVLGVLLIVDGILVKLSHSKGNQEREIKGLRFRDMVLVGIAQGISAFPGISRSGATTSTMLFLKISPQDSFRLSFIAGIPAALGATAVTVLFSNTPISGLISSIGTTTIIIAMVVSMLVSLVLINFLLKEAKRARMVSLVIALGIIAIISGSIAIATGLGG